MAATHLDFCSQYKSPSKAAELDLDTQCVVEMDSHQTLLHHPNANVTGKNVKQFTFDHSFWSFDTADGHYAPQADVFEQVGDGVLANAFHGYNACVFAYGQTGSGKSYTMMGSSGDEGLIPRLCRSMFDRIQQAQHDALAFKVEVSYLEIYNERVRDLLDPNHGRHNLRVREHNILGPYVDGLSCLAVSSFEQIALLMEEGNKSRTVAATAMNAESSRSHAVFNIILTQTLSDLQTGASGEKVSKMALVDLAGSERVTKSHAVGKRLEEGANINKSLTTLGMVISALAERSAQMAKAGSSRHSTKFIPYRDSVLTWLLKDSLGGNSRTVMLATISPSADNYDESLSTLRYADRAKRIENHAVVNEDPNAKIIRELRAEVDALRQQISEQKQTADLRERLAESEKLMSDIQKSWEERLQETERIHQERHRMLEQMGISVQHSGIKVEHGKFYLVNLNADPSMNEMLVYHLKDDTLIGSDSGADVRLQGLGVQPEHARLCILDNILHVEPVQSDAARSGAAKTCVNGTVVGARTRLPHGARLLIGNNHFFRVNAPKEPGMDESIICDYNAALHEVLESELAANDNAVATAIDVLEKQQLQWLAASQTADDRQKQQLYERHIRDLRSIISPETPALDYQHSHSSLVTPLGTPSWATHSGSFPRSDVQAKFVAWAQQRDDMMKQSLVKLKQDIVRANQLAREANLIAAEFNAATSYSVTLQIPASNLTPSKIKVWSTEKMDNKLVDMRDMYAEFERATIEEREQALCEYADPFFDTQENHNLIGVANVFLEVLFHDVRLDYHVPIISQQGQVSGRLHVEVFRIGEPDTQADATVSTDNLRDSARTITARVRVKAASGLPASLANFVFCQYSFFGQPGPTVVPPVMSDNQPTRPATHTAGVSFSFEHEQDFSVTVTEEFLEYCQEDALSIEVWGHRSVSPDDSDDVATKTKTVENRWAEVTRRVSLWVEMQELNEQGVYEPVEVQAGPDVLTGGVYQLKQGQQRRVKCAVSVEPEHGCLPLVPQIVTQIAIGSICTRNRSLQRPLDSYQEADLDTVKHMWSDALQERRVYLDEHIQRLMRKPDKSEQDVEREQSLISQWVALTEERNAVYIPAPNSSIPGAPAEWQPPSGIEEHIPVIHLNVESDQMTSSVSSETLPTAGALCILPKERSNSMFGLPILKYEHNELTAVASWDSSVHEHAALLKATEAHERVYAILKVYVRLSHPAEMDVVLRKRLAINVYKRSPTSLAGRIIRRFVGSTPLTGTGIHYDLLAHVPKSSFDAEDRSSLALMAGRGEESDSADGESYMERYTRGISAVESILALDRLRQEVAIKELLSAKSAAQAEAEAASSPAVTDMKRANSLPAIDKHCLHRGSTVGLSNHQASLLGLMSPASAAASGGSNSRLRELTRRAAMAPLNEEHKRERDASPTRSATVPESLTADAAAAASSSSSAATHKTDHSLGSSGYGSQVFSARSETSVDNLSTIAENNNEPNNAAAVDKTNVDNVMITSTFSDYGASIKHPSDSSASTHTCSSSTTSSSGTSTALPSWLTLNGRARHDGLNAVGTVRYIGATEFDSGLWVGLQLDRPNGTGDGSVSGIRYFGTGPQHALFARVNQLSPP